MNSRHMKGFSLIELMIVIAIIGILIVIIIPSYKIYTRRAHYIEVIHAANPFKIGIEECFQITSTLADCHAGENGIPAAIENGSGLVSSVTISSQNQIIVTPKAQYGITPEDTYILTPIVKQDTLKWITSGGGVSHGYAN